MLLKNLLVSLVVALSAHAAWASSDSYCEPTWTLNSRGYNRCSNVPLLSPGNDTRVNLDLLLVDNGVAALQTKPVSKEDEEFGYGKVPFSVDTFVQSIFVAVKKPGDPDIESSPVMYGGFTTRCDSNSGGAADFIEALEQSKDVPAAEQQLLTEHRKKLTPACVDAGDYGESDYAAIYAKGISSPAGMQFVQYLGAAAAFYDGHYDEAQSMFAALGNSNQPWLKESSRYMLARTELNRAQQNAFDEFGFAQLDKVDRTALQTAEVKFNSYLKEYPEGSYAASARGLLRRVYWLSNQTQKLADEFEWQLNNPDSPQQNVSLHELTLEADNKLLFTTDPSQIKSPLLLATVDLSLMRADSSGAHTISFTDLQKQQPLFAKHTALFDYLLAAHRFYVQKDAAGVLKALPDTIPAKMTYLDFSRLVLRGLALEATQDQPGARRLWQRLIPLAVQPLQNETLQLALALNYEYGNELERVFEPKSPITEPEIRAILLRKDASAALLRKMITSKANSSQERGIALYTLLYKDLLQGQYQDYIHDYRLLSGAEETKEPSPGMGYGNRSRLALFAWSGKKYDDSYNCPSTLDIAKKLAKNPHDPHGLVCLGDFVNANDLASGPGDSRAGRHATAQSSAAKSAVLGAAPSHFPGKLFSRGEGYKTVIADAHAAPDLIAYTLYRAMKCYATSGYNHCGGNEVEMPVRKSWFQTLKKRYPGSDWAKSLKYFW